MVPVGRVERPSSFCSSSTTFSLLKHFVICKILGNDKQFMKHFLKYINNFIIDFWKWRKKIIVNNLYKCYLNIKNIRHHCLFLLQYIYNYSRSCYLSLDVMKYILTIITSICVITRLNKKFPPKNCCSQFLETMYVLK